MKQQRSGTYLWIIHTDPQPFEERLPNMARKTVDEDKLMELVNANTPVGEIAKQLGIDSMAYARTKVKEALAKKAAADQSWRPLSLQFPAHAKFIISLRDYFCISFFNCNFKEDIAPAAARLKRSLPSTILRKGSTVLPGSGGRIS